MTVLLIQTVLTVRFLSKLDLPMDVNVYTYKNVNNSTAQKYLIRTMCIRNSH